MRASLLCGVGLCSLHWPFWVSRVSGAAGGSGCQKYFLESALFFSSGVGGIGLVLFGWRLHSCQLGGWSSQLGNIVF